MAGKLVRVWDLPVRVFHWSIVFLVIFSWATVQLDFMRWHKLSGYTILALLLARLGWGIFGSTTARFGHFVRGPKAVWAYARTFFRHEPGAQAGHNPMGALSVIALLLSLATQIGSGLILSDTDFINSGPLSALVSYDVARIADRVHGISFTVLECLVALHVAVILFYRFYKRESLIGPMITGTREMSDLSPAGSLRFRPAWWALAMLIVAAVFVRWLVTQAVPAIPG